MTQVDFKMKLGDFQNVTLFRIMANHGFIGINLCHYRINFILHACDYALFHWLDVKVKVRLCFCQLRKLSVCCVRWIFTHKYWFKGAVLRNFEAAHVCLMFKTPFNECFISFHFYCYEQPIAYCIFQIICREIRKCKIEWNAICNAIQTNIDGILCGFHFTARLHAILLHHFWIVWCAFQWRELF